MAFGTLTNIFLDDFNNATFDLTGLTTGSGDMTVTESGSSLNFSFTTTDQCTDSQGSSAAQNSYAYQTLGNPPAYGLYVLETKLTSYASQTPPESYSINQSYISFYLGENNSGEIDTRNRWAFRLVFYKTFTPPSTVTSHSVFYDELFTSENWDTAWGQSVTYNSYVIPIMRIYWNNSGESYDVPGGTSWVAASNIFLDTDITYGSLRPNDIALVYSVDNGVTWILMTQANKNAAQNLATSPAEISPMFVGLSVSESYNNDDVQTSFDYLKVDFASNGTPPPSFPAVYAFEDVYPAYNATDVATNTNITFDIPDLGGYIDISTLYVDATVDYVTSVIYQSGGFQTGFSGSVTFVPNGSNDGYDMYSVVINPDADFGGGKNVSVYMYIENPTHPIYAGYAESLLDFTTQGGAWSPFSESEYPNYTAYINVNPHPTIQFTVADSSNEIDFDPDTLTGTSDFQIYLRLEGVENLVYDSNAGGFQLDYAGSTLVKVPGGSIGGYDAFVFTINTSAIEFVYQDDPRINVIITDPGQLESNFVWSFINDVDLGIVVESISPANGSTNAEINTHLSFTIASSTSAILLDNYTTISINSGAGIWDSSSGVFQSGYDGPGSSFAVVPNGSIDGYDAYNFVIDFTSNFTYNELFSYNIDVTDIRTYIPV